MKKFVCSIALVLAAGAFAQQRRAVPTDSFASDSQTIPVMANNPGIGGAVFQTYVALLNLAANGWGQTSINAIVSGGYVVFEPEDSAVCYAVVVDNSTNDGRFISAAEYKP